MQAGRASVTLLTLGLVVELTTGVGGQLGQPTLWVALRTAQAGTSGSTLLAGDTFAIVRVDTPEPRTLVALPADDAVREFRRAFTAGAAPAVSPTVEIPLPALASESESEAASILDGASLEVVLFQDLDGNGIWSQDEPFVSAWHGGRGSYRLVHIGAPDASRPGAQPGWNLEEGGVPPVYHTDLKGITVFIDPVMRAIERP